MKNLKITVNGKSYDVQVEEVGAASAAAAAPVAAAPAAPVTSAAPAAAPAPAPAAAGEGEKIECPMSGTVLKIPVSAGQSVKRGDILLILEAMKMENEIFAPARRCCNLRRRVSRRNGRFGQSAYVFKIIIRKVFVNG